ncbi:MAG: hypothetical protein IRY95_10875, partial [Clostridia bacterium]|nr:hypothetical protein [Clostridia bacterium]
DVERLLQVRILRAQGMTVRDVKELLERDGGREARERVASLPDYEARLRDIHLSRRLANLPGGERTLLIRRAQLQREWGIGRQSERDDG